MKGKKKLVCVCVWWDGGGWGSIVILCFSTERREFQSHSPEMEKPGGTLWLLPTPKGRDDLPAGESAPASSLYVCPFRASLSTEHLHSCLPCERG